MSSTVSVVIPTRNRAELVCRAVRSALAQTYQQLEVVVVIDGPDHETTSRLASVNDPRLRVLELATSLGGGGARMEGVHAAKGPWIAFLDDDDEWLPQKLELQMRVAARSASPLPIIACQVIGRSPRGDYIWPRRVMRTGEPLGDYLFARKGLFQGEGLIQTTMIVAPRELLERVPFRSGLRRHQEWDWLLRASQEPGASIEFVTEPCAIWYVEEKRATISSTNDWQYSYEWLQEVRHLISPRAYAAFELTLISALAARQGDWKAFGPLLRDAFTNGRPKLIDVALYLGMWSIPQGFRRRLRALLTRQRSA